MDCTYTAELRLKELSQDAVQADLWFLKECGGRKRLRRLMDRLSKQVWSENRALVTNVCEFQSPRQNRWLVYLQGTPGSQGEPLRWVRLCVCEGAEAPTVYLYLSDKQGQGYAAFTARFFTSYADGLGYAPNDPAVLAQFILDLKVGELRIYEPDEEGSYALEWGFQQGLATGFIESFRPYVLILSDYWLGGTPSVTRSVLRQQALERLRKGVKTPKSDDPHMVMMTNFLVALLNGVLVELGVPEEKRVAFFATNQLVFAERVASLLREWYAEGKGLHMASLLRMFREFQRRAGIEVAELDEPLMLRMERIAQDMYTK